MRLLRREPRRGERHPGQPAPGRRPFRELLRGVRREHLDHAGHHRGDLQRADPRPLEERLPPAGERLRPLVRPAPERDPSARPGRDRLSRALRFAEQHGRERAGHEHCVPRRRDGRVHGRRRRRARHGTRARVSRHDLRAGRGLQTSIHTAARRATISSATLLLPTRRLGHELHRDAGLPGRKGRRREHAQDGRQRHLFVMRPRTATTITVDPVVDIASNVNVAAATAGSRRRPTRSTRARRSSSSSTAT